MPHAKRIAIATALALTFSDGAAARCSAQSCASGQTAAAPVADGTVDAGALASSGAVFGWTMSKGILGAPGHDSYDDLVVSAFLEDTSGGSATNEGAAYPFRDASGTLVAHTYNHLLPTNPFSQTALELGRLGNAIGNPRSANSGNLVLLGAMFRRVDYSQSGCGTVAKSSAGVVEVYDLSVSASPTTLVPPVASGNCDPGDISHFGHAIALGNVDGSATDDVVVGAPASDSGRGRVYVFFGNASFPSSYSWIGIEAPSGTANGAQFGSWVACEELDGDGYADVLVCSYERTIGTGHVYLYSGADINNAKSNGALVNTLVSNVNLAPAQTIAPPVGSTSDGFGWQIYPIGDMGSRLASCDGRPDIAIWSEYVDTSTHADRGALFVFFNSSSTGSPSLNTSAGNVLQLTSPVSSGTNQARYGRGASRVNWKDSAGNVYKGLLVGEPGYKLGSSDGAGRVYLYYGPLGPSTSSSSYQWALDNPNPQADAYFGANIVSLKYNGSYAGDQFVVSAREEDWGSPSTVTDAGKAYKYRAN